MEEHILFSKIQQGDAGAFEWLYKKYHPRMYVFCYGLLHDSCLLYTSLHYSLARCHAGNGYMLLSHG